MRSAFSSMFLVFFALGTAFAQEMTFPSGPQYLMASGSPLFARPISTPSMSLSGPPLAVGASDATGVLIPGAENRTVLPPLAVALPSVDFLPIYYGYRPPSSIEISFSSASGETQPPNPLPASILDTGASQITTVQALREHGYGVTLAEAAAYRKARSHPPARVYTNADIDKLRGGS